MNLDYIELKRYFDREKFSAQKARKYSAIFSKIEEVIDPSEIELVYPRNLFLDDKDLEFYILLSGKILRCILLDDKTIQLQIFNLEDLKDFKCEGLYDEEGFYKLTLKFENGEVIVFSSIEDSNDNWRYQFNEHIKELVKMLIKHS